MQFSVHTSSDTQRRELIPIKTLDLSQLALAGDRFFTPGDRKITLNFAVVKGYPVDAGVIARYFSPERFIVKATPVNPTISSHNSSLEGVVKGDDPTSYSTLKSSFKNKGFDVIVSIGEQRENQIGSNCGMYVEKLKQSV